MSNDEKKAKADELIAKLQEVIHGAADLFQHGVAPLHNGAKAYRLRSFENARNELARFRISEAR